MQHHNDSQSRGAGYEPDPDDEKYSIYNDPEAFFRAMSTSLPVPEIKSADEVHRDADDRRRNFCGASVCSAA
jgi:hypothetical protein